MIRSGSAIRFTGAELAEFLEIGLDFSGVRNEDDVGRELRKWAEVVATERPDLLMKIARALADAKGVQLPAELSVVRDKRE